MTQSSKEEIYKKWAPIMNNLGLAGSQSDWMSEYAQMYLDETKIVEENTNSNEVFKSIMLMVMRVASKTIGQDIGGFTSKEEIDEVKNRILQENRDDKIESITEDKPYSEKCLEDDEEYKKLMNKGVTPMSAPSGSLFYLDFKYGDGLDNN